MSTPKPAPKRATKRSTRKRAAPAAKSKRATKAKTGRPLIVIDEQLVRALAQINCTMEEIGAVVRCSVDTLERRFADVIKEEREHGRASLRRKQWGLALSGHPTMLIWLGKQELGQRDQARTELTTPPGQPIETRDLGDAKASVMAKVAAMAARVIPVPPAAPAADA